MKPLTNKIKNEQTQFFNKKFNRNHFDKLIKDCPLSMVSIFIYPTIHIHHLTIREQYSIKIDQSFSRTIPSPMSDVLNENALILSSPPISPSFIHEFNENIQEDVDSRLQTDMEQILDT
ncbi:unnamed protein product, partial [Rotaria sp. Silwood2]